MTKTIQFGDDNGAYIENFGNGMDKDTSNLKENNEIDYLGHIKAGIEVLNTKEDITESTKNRINQIFKECDLNNILIDLKGIKYFQSETNKKILSMIEIVLINYSVGIKK